MSATMNKKFLYYFLVVAAFPGGINLKNKMCFSFFFPPLFIIISGY